MLTIFFKTYYGSTGMAASRFASNGLSRVRFPQGKMKSNKISTYLDQLNINRSEHSERIKLRDTLTVDIKSSLENQPNNWIEYMYYAILKKTSSDTLFYIYNFNELHSLANQMWEIECEVTKYTDDFPPPGEHPFKELEEEFTFKLKESLKNNLDSWTELVVKTDPSLKELFTDVRNEQLFKLKPKP